MNERVYNLRHLKHPRPAYGLIAEGLHTPDATYHESYVPLLQGLFALFEIAPREVHELRIEPSAREMLSDQEILVLEKIVALQNSFADEA